MTLPDLQEVDLAGSGFTITGHTVHGQLDGDAAMARLRGGLRLHVLKLLFAPYCADSPSLT
jgi:hypothetical protein